MTIGRADAIIIGAGPNGLAAAITIARAGRSVVVCEARESVGGGARTEGLTLPGFRHDVCSTAFPLGIGSPLFRRLPLGAHGLDWVHPDICLAHPFDDGTAAVLAWSMTETADSLADMEDASAYRGLVQPLADRWRDLTIDILAPLHVPRHPVLLARFGIGAIRSAAGLVQSRFRGERARALVAGLAAHSALPIESVPSAAFALVLAAAAHADGWPFARDGAGRITEALASYLRTLDGRIVVGRRVDSLDDLPPARAYLFDTAPREVLRIAGDRLPEHYRHRLAAFRHGPGACTVHWALDSPIPWKAEACRRAGVVHVGGAFGEIAESERAPWEGRTHPRPFVILAQPSVCDPSRAPDGKHVGWAYCHVPNGSADDVSAAIELQVERFAPGFRSAILARAVRTAAELAAHNPGDVGGDITGGASILSQVFTRPVAYFPPYATPDPRIWLCGASTPPGGGVHGMCGFHAARAALRGRLGGG